MFELVELKERELTMAQFGEKGIEIRQNWEGIQLWGKVTGFKLGRLGALPYCLLILGESLETATSYGQRPSCTCEWRRSH